MTMPAAAAPLVETWAIHHRVHLYLLAALPAAALEARTGGRGRSVALALAHVHNVRLMWLKSAAPEHLAGLEKFEAEAAPSAAELGVALAASSAAVEALIAAALAGDGRVKGFKPHVTAFVGYLISHESHHRGQIMVALRESGHVVDKTVAYGIWEWGSR